MSTDPVPSRSLRRVRPVIGALLLLLAIVVAGCINVTIEPPTFVNQSDQTIIIFRVSDTSESVHKEILPGSTSMTLTECVDPDLEARLDGGAVVAFRAGPFCQGDPEWLITQAQVDAAK